MSWGGIENALESGEEVPEVPEDQGIFTPITKKPGRGDVEDVQAAVTDPNIADENLDDRLGGIGLKLSLDPGEGVIRVAEIDLGGPCYHPVEVRMRHSQNVAHLAQRRSSVPANTSSISIPYPSTRNFMFVTNRLVFIVWVYLLEHDTEKPPLLNI